VKFEVTTPKWAWQKANSVWVEKGVGPHGFGWEHGTNTAHWWAEGGRLFGAYVSPYEGVRHSVGHFLGLREGYDTKTGQTKPGFQGHLMDRQPGGSIPAHDMNRILNRSEFQHFLLRMGAQVE
jgi:hypothetical protein